MNYRQRFRIGEGEKVDLKRFDPDTTDGHHDKQSANAEIAQLLPHLQQLQALLYAENRRSLLICLQAMDAGGKDGTIRHVIGPLNPQGTRVHSFKVPTPEEAAHDFLWRIHRQVPARGEIAIFNRSHYEDVLVTRVHQLVPKKVWSQRYRQIVAFEENLTAAGTQILKFFLHISPEEQLRRFKQRLDDPGRHWKISLADYSERELWPDYQQAYAEALAKTSTATAPWFVIPANHKWFRNLAVTRILIETLEAMKMAYPPPSVDLEEIRQRYHAAEQDPVTPGERQ
ncbi:polyphosphate kinase 2 family protein [Desulfuromonas carbonis]|uniref:polyphosphate kinase 2 family protein n=1 Tax=Desulfuromonas sp. DDH964 TaxID=1823759 RepID=UPI00078D7188|nr:polyphosphate kinase 2 family protein [Desulfuromonas sp. DDH964]AMV73698.1 polyphosphate-dependent AMP kinase [Desulfuromonas sp. DDH964]